MTQEDLVAIIDDMGVEFSQPLLSQIENGIYNTHNISAERAMALCIALNMRFEQLFRKDDEEV